MWLVILVIAIVDILNLKSNLNISELQGFYFLKSLVIKAIEVEFQHELEIQVVKNKLHLDYIICFSCFMQTIAPIEYLN